MVNYVKTYEYKVLENSYEFDENTSSYFDRYYDFDYNIVFRDGTEINVYAKDKTFSNLLNNLFYTNNPIIY